MGYRFGKASKRKLATATVRMQNVMREALRVSPMDFGISEGHRSLETQKKYFKEGKSKLDGVTKLSKHQRMPSHAVDIYAYHSGKAQWDKESIIFLAGIIIGVAKKMRVRIRWGGNWDGDGIIIHDQSFQDLVHFEVIP